MTAVLGINRIGDGSRSFTNTCSDHAGASFSCDVMVSIFVDLLSTLPSKNMTSANITFMYGKPASLRKLI